MALGITLIILACFVAVGIGYVANKNAKEYDESKHESFLG
jgi:hypothetical protein